jgi:hypothetical protein
MTFRTAALLIAMVTAATSFTLAESNKPPNHESPRA